MTLTFADYSVCIIAISKMKAKTQSLIVFFFLSFFSPQSRTDELYHKHYSLTLPLRYPQVKVSLPEPNSSSTLW